MTKTHIKPNSVLLSPRITEKAAILADKNNVYVFEVTHEANKESIAASIREKYKVTPVKVRVVNVAPRKVFVRGRLGSKKGMKKAYVYLKKGDKIELL
jgi:large subunit ribosomal protein L23